MCYRYDDRRTSTVTIRHIGAGVPQGSHCMA